MSLLVFLDECGYTGEDLVNVDQPVFVMASHGISEERCQELKNEFFGKVQARELKHSRLARRPSQRGMILKFLRFLQDKNQPVKISIVHKKYAIVCKIVELIEIVTYEDGLDLYDKGCNIAFANLLFYALPAFEGQAFFDNLLLTFQRMIRERTIKSYKDFFKPLFAQEHSKNTEDLLFFIKAIQRLGYSLLKRMPSNYLDIALTCALCLMAMWRKETFGDIELIHDSSTNMARQKHIWDALVDPTAPPAVIGYDRRRMFFPISVSRTIFESSADWAGLQLADILAGATAASLEWILKGKNTADPYCQEVLQLVSSFDLHCLWPSPKVTPGELETTEENAANPFDYIAKLVRNLGKK